MLFTYFTTSWATTGRTYGNHLMGLRVVNYRGERMRWAGAAVRAVFCLVFPIGLYWAVVSHEQQVAAGHRAPDVGDLRLDHPAAGDAIARGAAATGLTAQLRLGSATSAASHSFGMPSPATSVRACGRRSRHRSSTARPTALDSAGVSRPCSRNQPRSDSTSAST